MLKAWVIRDLEPLPISQDNRRLMRAGLLSKALAERGHQTTWFASNFDHYKKRFQALPLGPVNANENLTIHVLKGAGYESNVSLRRVWHNRRFAADFAAAASQAEHKPDVIITDLPTTEASAAAIRFASSHDIPSILSVRDLWPDTFGRYVRPPWRQLMPFLSLPMQRQVRYACRNASSLVGVSTDYLEWGLAKGKRSRSNLDLVIPLSHAPATVKGDDIAMMRSDLGLRSDQKIVSFVGSWGDSIKMDWLLEIARSHRHRDDVVFVIGGDGQNRAHIGALQALPTVIVTGWLDARRLAALLSMSELALLPYAVGAPQSIPNKVYDYMAYGVFQIGTLQGATRQIYAESGIGHSVQPTAAALARAVGQYLDSPPSVTREDIKTIFDKHYGAKGTYDKMVGHVETVVEEHQGAGATNGFGGIDG